MVIRKKVISIKFRFQWIPTLICFDKKNFSSPRGPFWVSRDQKRPGWDPLTDPLPKNSYFDVHYTWNGKTFVIFISGYCFTQAFHSHDIYQEFVKKWAGRIISNSLFLREVTCCYNRLWEFSTTKPICYKDVFVNSFCSTTSTLVNSLIVEPCLFLWLIFWIAFKSWVNTIQSKAKW